MTRPPPTPPLFPSTPLSRPLEPARRRPPLRCTEQPQPLGERRKPPQRVVLPEQQSKLGARRERSEEHTSELQSLAYLVCRLLLEKKKETNTTHGVVETLSMV